MIDAKHPAIVGVASLLVACAVLLTVPPASGYEIYIYTAYPWYFWAAIVGAIVGGQVAVLAAATGGRVNGSAAGFGAAVSVGGVLVVTVLPSLRGYPVYGRADVLTHLGLIADLETVGTAENIYPPTHLVVQALSGATGLEPMTVIQLLPVAFTGVFLGSLYYLVRRLYDRQRALFALPFVLAPVLAGAHVTAVPFALSLLFTPLVVYLLVAERATAARPVRLLLAVTIVGLVLYHPLTAVFLLIVLALYAVIERTVAPGRVSPTPARAALFAGVVFGARYLTMTGILIRFQTVTDDFLGGGGRSQLGGTVDTIERTSPEFADVLKIAVFQYGSTAILYGLAALLLAVVAGRWLRDRGWPGHVAVVFGAVTVTFAGLGVLFLTNDFIVGFGRPLAFGEIFAAVLAGSVWYVAWQRTDRAAGRAAVTVALVVVLAAVVGLTVASTFSSPIVAETNQQVTEMELDGMAWTFENRNDEMLVEEFGIDQYRFYDLRYGVENATATVRREGTVPPDHFNYTTYETLGRSYESDHYLVLTRLGRITYPVKFPGYRDQWAFTPADFARIQFDPTVAQVYDNGEFETYRIDGTGSGVDPAVGSASPAERPR